MRSTVVKSPLAKATLLEGTRSLLEASATALQEQAERFGGKNAQARAEAIEKMEAEIEVFNELLAQLKQQSK